ncbi:MAG TPA: hypothetical protein VNB49_01050 [Candidatus Dormibacteraeota bacterium]|nr:hypothetical protein [Candidatus Dormibacteraeota bacterium]
MRTHETQSLVAGLGGYRGTVVSPDGQWLLFTQNPGEGHASGPARLMRMPLNGGPATVLLSGVFSYRCAFQANICVLSEVVKDQRIFSLLDPLRGRGADVAQAAGASNADWSLSADGKKISLLSDSEPSNIQILNLDDGRRSAIALKGWSVQSTSWSPDNRHLYVSGGFGSGFRVALASLDGQITSLLDTPLGEGWPFGLRPSPDGRYLGYTMRLFEGNVVMLEDY